MKGGVASFAGAGRLALVKCANGGQQRLGKSPLLAERQSAGDSPPENKRLGAAGGGRMSQLALDGLPRFGNAPVIDRQAIAGAKAIAEQIQPAGLVRRRFSAAGLQL